MIIIYFIFFLYIYPFKVFFPNFNSARQANAKNTSLLQKKVIILLLEIRYILDWVYLCTITPYKTHKIVITRSFWDKYIHKKMSLYKIHKAIIHYFKMQSFKEFMNNHRVEIN